MIMVILYVDWLIVLVKKNVLIQCIKKEWQLLYESSMNGRYRLMMAILCTHVMSRTRAYVYNQWQLYHCTCIKLFIQLNVSKKIIFMTYSCQRFHVHWNHFNCTHRNGHESNLPFGFLQNLIQLKIQASNGGQRTLTVIEWLQWHPRQPCPMRAAYHCH